mmetsp:Transcript_27654/g.83405  ORF Transcript_27654/g.83405 Transcript_27654/m.83405 type:complete len:264 (+) Transcript_27654:869-1660(+)
MRTGRCRGPTGRRCGVARPTGVDAQSWALPNRLTATWATPIGRPAGPPRRRTGVVATTAAGASSNVACLSFATTTTARRPPGRTSSGRRRASGAAGGSASCATSRSPTTATRSGRASGTRARRPGAASTTTWPARRRRCGPSIATTPAPTARRPCGAPTRRSGVACTRASIVRAGRIRSISTAHCMRASRSTRGPSRSERGVARSTTAGALGHCSTVPGDLTAGPSRSGGGAQLATLLATTRQSLSCPTIAGPATPIGSEDGR